MNEPDEEVAWDPDGTDLARALLARARSEGRSENRRTRRATRKGKRGAGRSTGSGWSGPGRDERDPQPLDIAVDRLVGEHGWGEEIAVHGVIARWAQIVGPEIAAHVRTERYTNGELTVRADSTAWATQVRLLAPDLVRKLNSEIGDGNVTRVNVLGPHAPSWRKGPRSVPGRGPRDTYG
jgi:predicted nucleic acid-binding Zn ribbon protein